MSKIESFTVKHPALSVILLSLLWLIITLLFSGIASGMMHKNFGDTSTYFYAHLLTAVCLFVLFWRLNWLKPAGVSGSGDVQTWLITIIGTVYYSLASLWAYYGEISFDFSTLADLSSSGEILKTNAAVSLNEEFLFRGAVLLILLRSWGNTRKGIAGSVMLSSGIFALFHFIQIFSSGLSLLSVFLLAGETVIVSAWWASLVLAGKSIWPAVLVHFTINVAVAVQAVSGINIPNDPPVYLKLLLLSLPLGVISIWMLNKLSFHIRNQQKSS